MKHFNDDTPELPGCPVLISQGLYELDETNPTAAFVMLLEHLKDESRTCCDRHGFALVVDRETGCTPSEMLRKPVESQGGKTEKKEEVA